MSAVVSVQSLVKVYPGGTRAVDGIDFTVEQGEFFGLLGPNGAGKSTTLKILATILKKTSGSATVAGYDVEGAPTGVRKSIGFAMQEVGVDDLVKGRDFLALQGILYGQSQKDARARANELLDLVGLTAVAGRAVGTYSGGMRRRIDLAAALMHRPPLLFLDEPTTGLDPQSRLAIWDHLRHLNQQGITVILTTQIMEEADRLCQRLAIIDHGKLVAQGSPQALKDQLQGDMVSLTIREARTPSEGRQNGVSAAMAKALEVARERSGVTGAEAQGSVLTIATMDSDAAVPDLLRAFNEKGINVASLSVAKPTLDDVFLKYTGRNIRSEGAGGDEVGASLRPWLGLSKK